MVGTVDCSARTKTKKSYDKRICNKKDEVTIRYESHKCLKKFPSPSQNDSITKKFICDICTRHFSTKKLLRLHMVRHVGIKQFSCLVCSKKFFTSSELRKHTNYWHPGNVMYQCVECSQAFRWYATFAEHMRKEHKRRVKQKSSNVEFRWIIHRRRKFLHTHHSHAESLQQQKNIKILHIKEAMQGILKNTITDFHHKIVFKIDF